MESTPESTHITWLSFSAREKKQFLAENLKPKLETALYSMNTLPEKGGACMVCIVEALERNPTALQNKLNILILVQ